MQEEDFVCEVCDSEFTVKHYEEDEVAFCPFCGETLFKDDEDDITNEWDDEDDQ